MAEEPLKKKFDLNTVSASDVAFIQDKWKCDGIVRGLEIARGKIKKAFEGLE